MFYLLIICLFILKGDFSGFTSRVVEDLERLVYYLAHEKEWVDGGRPLFSPGKYDFLRWKDGKRGEMAPDEYERIGTKLEDSLYSRRVVRDDGVVHKVKHLVPGSNRFLYYFYDWDLGYGGRALWPY